MNREEARAASAAPGDQPGRALPVIPLCACGCGGVVSLIEKSAYARGLIAGQPRTWLKGHHRRLLTPAWVENAQTGCWDWQRCRNATGYAVWSRAGRSRLVHRALWEAAHGPVPAGLELDHVCGNKGCVNPRHLEAVTHAENVRRYWARRRAAGRLGVIVSIREGDDIMRRYDDIAA